MPLSSSGAIGDVSLADLVTTASCEPVIDETSESLLIESCREGHTGALEKLIRANLRIVIDEAIRERGLGERQADMVRRGLQALVESADRYDPSRDGSFSAYARGAVRNAIRQGFPAH
jgi:DNA-directed RNA polymerase specialized sigma subunit